MKLIVGLGNPGEAYANTLHNMGFRAVDLLSNHLQATLWREKFKADMVKSKFNGQDFILLKPLTFMNLSGQSVVACTSFFKIELKDMLVVYDDLDLPVGKMRYRENGGHGGHNGIRNIMEQCGSSQFARLKLGIGRPKGKQAVSDYVLNKPNQENQIAIDLMLENSVSILDMFLQNKTIRIQN